MTHDQLEPGHRYSYRVQLAGGGARMGTVYARPDGTLTLKPGGITADWPTANARHLAFEHATYDCHGCDIAASRQSATAARAAGTNVVDLRPSTNP